MTEASAVTGGIRQRPVPAVAAEQGTVAERQTAPRITQLDGIRAVAIGAVFVHHAFSVKLLWSGVDLFFVLSGFLITGILIAQKKTRSFGAYIGHFYQRRARRILVPYAMLLVLTTVFFGASWMRHAEFYLFLMNLLRWMGIPELRPLGHMWSLAVEEQFYLFWPLVVFSLSETAITWVAGGLMVLAPLLRWTCAPYFKDMWPIYMMTPFRMDCLAAGALLAIVWHRRRHWIERYGKYGLGLSGIAGVLLVVVGRIGGFDRMANTRQSNTVLYELTLMASVGAIVWALSGRFVQPLQWAPVRYLGRISYTVYLVHILALALAERYVHGTFQVAAVAAAGTLLYAALSWRFVELPLLGSRPKEPTVVLAPALAEGRERSGRAG